MRGDLKGQALRGLDADLARAVSRASEAIAEALIADVGDAALLDALTGVVVALEFSGDTALLTRLQDAFNADALDVLGHRGGVDGWVWRSLPGCCPVCAVLTGQVFPLAVPMWGHPRCRCTPEPVYAGQRVRDGYLVRARIPRAQIAAMLPKVWGKLPADLRDLLTVRDDGLWRPVRQMRNPNLPPLRVRSGVA